MPYGTMDARTATMIRERTNIDPDTLTAAPTEGVALCVAIIWEGSLDEEWLTGAAPYVVRTAADAIADGLRAEATCPPRDWEVVVSEVYVSDAGIEPTGAVDWVIRS